MGTSAAAQGLFATCRRGLIALLTLGALLAPCSRALGAWDDGFWLSGPNDEVTAVAFVGTDIYIGGRFTAINDQLISYLAKWDGSSWSALSSGVDGPVLALTVVGSDRSTRCACRRRRRPPRSDTTA